MTKAELYRQYAKECREIAATLPGDQKSRLLEIAKSWDECANAAESHEAKNKGAHK